MKILLIILFVFATSVLKAQTAYTQFSTIITCPSDKIALADSAHKKIQKVLSAMSKEGLMINFNANKKEEKEKIKLIYSIPSENEENFNKIVKEWKARATASDPSLFKEFWQISPTSKDTVANIHKMMYPLIKSTYTGVVVVTGIDEKPDPNLDYKIIADLTAFPESDKNKGKVDSTGMNWGLAEIGRLYNLHLAAGIPQNKIHFVVAVHANAMESFFNNEAYQKKYKMDNPNLARVEELSNAGVKFLLCGQSLTWWGFRKDMLLPQVKLTLTAQTTLSSYQMQGYALKVLRND
jgi:intracellular sulfur oxidation DsrE/DsrF family protein